MSEKSHGKNSYTKAKHTNTCKRRGTQNRKRITLSGIILIVLSVLFGGVSFLRTGTPLPTAELFDGKPTIRFIDVGQGDCTLITYKGDSVLIDAGPASSGSNTAAYVYSYAPIVDYFIITHPHEDHMGGAADILENVYVKNMILNDETSDNRFYTAAMEAAYERGVNLIYVEPDEPEVFTIGDIKITLLDSGLDDESENEDFNNISLVVRVDVGSTSIMTVGDAESPVESELLQNYAGDSILDCDILKVGHHGSSTSTTEEFLEAVSPEICVISCGENNSYGHPHRETMELLNEYGAEIHRTDKEGTVILRGEQ